VGENISRTQVRLAPFQAICFQRSAVVSDKNRCAISVFKLKEIQGYDGTVKSRGQMCYCIVVTLIYTRLADEWRRAQGWACWWV